MASVRVDHGKVLTFEDEPSFYRWLGAHWDRENELWIKIHKMKSGLKSITPIEAVDVVLCFGWIDAVRKAFDDRSYLQRYTPRGKKSIWSQMHLTPSVQCLPE